MKLKRIKSLWGMEGSLSDQFKAVSDAGYSGIESPLPAPGQHSEFMELLQEHQLDYVAQIFAEETGSFEKQVEEAVNFQPLLINSQSAKADMPYEDQLDFFTKAVGIEKQAQILIGHETHRGRAMFTPWNTERLLKDIEDLSITADFSHWVCVCESLLNDQADRLDLAIQRTVHIHTRVGFTQGPQVPDPRAPEYKEELDIHSDWWRKIAEAHRQKGAGALSFTPEYGPPGYMHTEPFTKRPLADLWEICLWMGNFVEERLKV
ncbi:sugar phosphate isomerase/epimerase [Metabacillus sp. KIGAM252]|uniref:Sugar phosphate isomerase/epimerase n=1 Tax=Metabacillus flavus TaxID=2823519 RepID=A0ABS5LH46_9BACI|nr:sugar phosphate isomerase/epimerase [Metabacillus flavus]MBS2970074.1 sugar phosphate isomerase/epimerase [Metabacillus flavus]